MLAILYYIASLGVLVCWIMAIVAAFKKEEKPLMGILMIVLGFCTAGLGSLILGWVKSGAWGIQKIMLIWTVLLIASGVLGYLSGNFTINTGMPVVE